LSVAADKVAARRDGFESQSANDSGNEAEPIDMSTVSVQSPNV